MNEFEENEFLNNCIDGSLSVEYTNWEKVSKHYNFLSEDILWKYRKYVIWEDVFAGRSPARPLSPDFVKKVKKYLETKVKKAEKEVEELEKLEKCLVSLDDKKVSPEKEKCDDKIGKWYRERPPGTDINHIIGYDKNGYIYEHYRDTELIGTYNNWTKFDTWEEISPPKQFATEKSPYYIIEYDEFQFLEIEK